MRFRPLGLAGLRFVQARVLDSSDPAYLALRKAFQDPCDLEPGITSLYRGEVDQALFEALSPDHQTPAPPGARLGSGRRFPGLPGPVNLVPGGGTGDTRFRVPTVKDGRLTKL
ncbi:MAG TPA: hypothetical protein VMB23_06905 [Spirochaetia bacterium]|jgi:hypothetical protein|nr:hypothetical protein [Spirochaetia bacterium]